MSYWITISAIAAMILGRSAMMIGRLNRKVLRNEEHIKAWKAADAQKARTIDIMMADRAADAALIVSLVEQKNALEDRLERLTADMRVVGDTHP